ncbi:FAD/NAD(P)-binding domain-containing protein [Aspergillus homomorphus CBS 101889]|uniref:FAD/NAD(P)-binding domain-containing protein n=1 Tax=Aspergillus homomorphus (strain CBS 101889) TaxID=1450537 RepID=A0A395HPR9_ASPHC|nr:FAD/NAD(P)-binding domain-containing protein [Aspergillus homomorphus CBS 101889]RAL08244.1 FAD/NAD(P)-binding domain-containing protein [Aspergillus homomorphus CBS 101889]
MLLHFFVWFCLLAVAHSWTQEFESPSVLKSMPESLDADLQDLLNSLSQQEVKKPTKIAIIGGGIAGVSIAYKLRGRESKTWSPQVTLFEQDSRLGGRIHSISRSDANPDLIEAGAATFDWDDLCVARLFREAGVVLIDPQDRETGDNPQTRSISLYDGHNIVGRKLSGPQTWTHAAKKVWQNRGSVWFWRHLLVRVVAIGWGEWYSYTWSEIVSTAANYAASAVSPWEDEVTRFATRFGLSVKPQISARWGNERALRRLALLSQATVRLNSTVTHITIHDERTFDVAWSTATDDGGSEEPHTDNFDAVIIAASLSQTGITITPELQTPPEPVEYTPLHITHFTSMRNLDPTAFNLSATERVPDEIWNLNLQSNHDESPSTTPPFLTLARTTFDWRLGCEIHSGNVFRVTSMAPLTDDDIARLFNFTDPGKVTFPHQNCDLHVTDSYAERGRRYPRVGGPSVFLDDMDHEGWFLRNWECTPAPRVRWVHRQVWANGVPVVTKADTEEDLVTYGVVGYGDMMRERRRESMKLAPGLFYVSGIEASNGASLGESVRMGAEVVSLLSCG